MHRWLPAIAALLSFLPASRAEPVEWRLGFDGPSGTFDGFPGEVKTFEVFPRLTESGNGGFLGPENWALSMEITGASIRSITLQGIVVDTIFFDDYDRDPETPPIVRDHHLQDLGGYKVFTKVARLATHKDDPSRKGAISTVWLDDMHLQPNSSQRIARLLVDAEIPKDETEREVVLRYEDGFKSATTEPFMNGIRDSGLWKPPSSLEECRFKVRKWPGIDYGLGFGFETCPPETNDSFPGDPMTFEVYLTLTTYGLPGPEGPGSWALGVGITWGRILSIDLGGIQVSTVFDHDGDPATPPLDPYPFDLMMSWKKDAELAVHADDPAREGAISMVVLDGDGRMSLRPNTTQRIAKIVVEARIPDDPMLREAVLRFEDGFRSTGAPRENRINIDDLYTPPSLGECRFSVQWARWGWLIPGDCNLSGLLEIGDAVCLFSKLFLEAKPRFLCGDGSISDLGNIHHLDWQPDNAIDISDGIAMLRFLFLGGPRHPKSIPDIETVGCVQIYNCFRHYCWE